MPITEQITWTMLSEKWPEPGDDPISLVVSQDDEDGQVFWVEDGCRCYSDSTDEGDHLRQYTWFEKTDGDSVEGHVHAWTTGATGKQVIDTLMPPQHWRKQPPSLIPFESELS